MVEIPTTARAAILAEFGKDYQLKKDHPVKPASELKPGECLVKIEYAGVCHSDLHVRAGDWAVPAAAPLVGGHEGIGKVVAIGAHSTTGVKVGDRVGCKWIAKTCMQYVLSLFLLMHVK